ncbi:MAG: hypothetical protein HC817_11900 [Saprospiraceae bacterium]|nr:hypothetical protein [Saprospiraceae bacterium]
MSKPAYKFELDSEDFFSEAAQFVNLKFESKDSTSGKLWAARLMQDILRFHQNDTAPEAFVDADLKRLKFVKNNAVVDDKTTLYEQALKKLLKEYDNKPVFAEIAHLLAQSYAENAANYRPNPDQKGRDLYKKAIELCRDAVIKYPKAYGVKNCKLLIAAITEPSLSVKVEEVNIPNKPILTHLSYRNLDSVYLKIVRMSDKINRRTFNDDEKLLQFSTVRKW